MKENMNQVITWLKEKNIKGCISGSCMIDYFDGADVDFFAYSEASFTEMFYAMYHDTRFQILEPLELWKAERFKESKIDNYGKTKLLTMKFYWNTCLPVNIIYKKNCTNGYSVISKFDMDLVAKCYDTFIQKELDLTGGSTISKIVSWNRYHVDFYNPDLWTVNKLLRQFERIIKYYKRGYNTDAVVIKYIELIDEILKLQDIFNSTNYTERLKLNKENLKVVKKLCELWLKTHEFTDEQLEALKLKIKEL